MNSNVRLSPTLTSLSLTLSLAFRRHSRPGNPGQFRPRHPRLFPRAEFAGDHRNVNTAEVV